MTSGVVTVSLVMLLSAQPESSSRSRVALFVGSSTANQLVPLRHAVSDARAVRDVFVALGGLHTEDAALLTEPTRPMLMVALASLKARVAAARQGAGLVQLIFYYSGHSDERGVLLKDGRLDWGELRAAVAEAHADLRLVILDSCSSGALTRAKGGGRVQPFMIDASTTSTGDVVITSTNDSEAARESDRLGSSYFTHALVSGLRGSADTSHDGRVTVDEAYSYAFHQTMESTEATSAGPQHPSYEMDVRGSGDVVLTDIHAASATLSVASLPGKYYFRTTESRLVAELMLEPNERYELALEPGSYVVRRVTGTQWFATDVFTLTDVPKVLTEAQFHRIDAPIDRKRGGADQTAVQSVFIYLQPVPSIFFAVYQTPAISLGVDGFLSDFISLGGDVLIQRGAYDPVYSNAFAGSGNDGLFVGLTVGFGVTYWLRGNRTGPFVTAKLLGGYRSQTTAKVPAPTVDELEAGVDPHVVSSDGDLSIAFDVGWKWDFSRLSLAVVVGANLGYGFNYQYLRLADLARWELAGGKSGWIGGFNPNVLRLGVTF